MAKNQKHEKKQNMQNEDKIEISGGCKQACEEELGKTKCEKLNAIDERDGVQSKEKGTHQKDAKVCEEKASQPKSTIEEDNTSSESLSVDKLSKEVEKWKNEYLRKAADFENYRKRMIKEKKDAIDYANETILQDLVNILDDFDRGIDAVEKYATDAIKPYMQGFEMIRKQLYSMLEGKYALKYYKSEGEKFDPNIHDAKASRESGEVEVETVEKELLKGYKLHDRVIRVAQVETVKPKK